jgi:chromosome segregation ATPase
MNMEESMFTLTESGKALLDKLFQESLVNPDMLRTEYEYQDQIRSLQQSLSELKSEAENLEKYRSAYDRVKREKDILAQNASTLQIKAAQSEELSEMVDSLKREIDHLKRQMEVNQSATNVSLEGFYQYLKELLKGRTQVLSSPGKVEVTVQATVLSSIGTPVPGKNFVFRIHRSNNKDAKVVASRF